MTSKTLQVLNLGNNSIGNEGALRLATPLLSESCSLRHLFLDENNIGAVGALALAKV